MVRAADDAVPFRHVLAGQRPWTIQLPAGVLALDVVDDDGVAMQAWCILGDHEDLLEPGEVLRGLPLGEHTLHLSAAGYRTAVVRAQVTDRLEPRRVVMQRR